MHLHPTVAILGTMLVYHQTHSQVRTSCNFHLCGSSTEICQGQNAYHAKMTGSSGKQLYFIVTLCT